MNHTWSRTVARNAKISTDRTAPWHFPAWDTPMSSGQQQRNAHRATTLGRTTLAQIRQRWWPQDGPQRKCRCPTSKCPIQFSGIRKLRRNAKYLLIHLSTFSFICMYSIHTLIIRMKKHLCEHLRLNLAMSLCFLEFRSFQWKTIEVSMRKSTHIIPSSYY